MQINWKLGDTSRKYEVGPNGGPGTVSTGKGDRGGVSYGTYQLSSKTGTCAQFVKTMGYSEYFGKNQPGSPLFTALWIKAVQKFPKFGEDQHEFIRITHYQVQMDYLSGIGIDLTTRGPAVQDAVWSTSVQFGPATSLIEKSLRWKSVNKMNDEEIVTTIQDYKIANNSTLFKSSSDSVKKSTLNRAKNEKSDLIKLATSGLDIVPDSIKNLFDAISDIGKDN